MRELEAKERGRPNERGYKHTPPVAVSLALCTCIITGSMAFPKCKKSRFGENGLVLGIMGIDIATCSTTAILAHCDSSRSSKKLITSIYDKKVR